MMKKLFMLLLVLVMVFSFAACGGADEEPAAPEQEEAEAVEPEEEQSEEGTLEIPEFTIEIVGGDVEAFTNADAANFDLVEFDAVKTSKDGSEETNHWVGVALKDVLAFAGVTEYTSLTVEAADGYAQEYTADIVEGDTILGFFRDGELLKNSGPIQLVAKDQPSNMWVKQFSKLTINK